MSKMSIKQKLNVRSWKFLRTLTINHLIYNHLVYTAFWIILTVLLKEIPVPLAESQKGVNAVQQCSVQNQKSAITIFLNSDSALLVLNGTAFEPHFDALLALNWRYQTLKNDAHYGIQRIWII